MTAQIVLSLLIAAMYLHILQLPHTHHEIVGTTPHICCQLTRILCNLAKMVKCLWFQGSS